MTDLREAAEMALEFIVLASSKDRAWFTEKEFEVVAALRQALSNEFNPDWNQVEALQESLRGHMAEIQRLRQALAQPDEVLAEREACAKLCDDLVAYTKTKGYDDAMFAAMACAETIRARGEK
jgi:uncharacterized membrane protein YccC